MCFNWGGEAGGMRGRANGVEPTGLSQSPLTLFVYFLRDGKVDLDLRLPKRGDGGARGGARGRRHGPVRMALVVPESALARECLGALVARVPSLGLDQVRSGTEVEPARHAHAVGGGRERAAARARLLVKRRIFIERTAHTAAQTTPDPAPPA